MKENYNCSDIINDNFFIQPSLGCFLYQFSASTFGVILFIEGIDDFCHLFICKKFRNTVRAKHNSAI